MNNKTRGLLATVGLLGACATGQAALIDAGNGMINDTVLNITWLQNAGASGPRTWSGLVSWAENLSYGGYDDWRLASLSVAGGVPTGQTYSPVNCASATELACRDNELGYMYRYYLLGGDAWGSNQTGNQTVGSLTLNNVQSVYWSGTQLVPDYAWYFDPADGDQDFGRAYSPAFGWAVRPGQVDAAPLPATGLLMALGLLALNASRRGRRSTLVIR